MAARRAYAGSTIAEEWPLLNMQGRIEALEARHRSLEDRIFEEDHRPAPDAAELARLKAEKLRLRDELERLRTQGAMPSGKD